MSHWKGPLDPSTPIVTAACLQPLGPSPSRPGQTKFRRMRWQRQSHLQQTTHLRDGQFGQLLVLHPPFSAALQRMETNQA